MYLCLPASRWLPNLFFALRESYTNAGTISNLDQGLGTDLLTFFSSLLLFATTPFDNQIKHTPREHYNNPRITTRSIILQWS